MSLDAFDTLIGRQSPLADAARIAAVIASDFRFGYFGIAAFAARLLRLDQKLIDGIPMNPRRMANVLNTKPQLLRCSAAISPSRATRPWCCFADGRPVEIPVF
jgi:hypothetical protein